MVKTLAVPFAVLVAASLATGPAQAQTPLRGVVHVVWDGGDSEDPDGRAFYLARPDGSHLRLDPGTGLGIDAASLTALGGQWVEIDVGPSTVPGRLGEPAARLEGLRALGLPPALPSPSMEADDFVTVLCRFGDDPSTPFTPEQVAVVHGPDYPGVAEFYQEQSRDPRTMSENTVAGWFDLPLERSAYVQGSWTDVASLVYDCTNAADAAVDFSRFYGVNLQFNGPLGTRSTPPYDGVSMGGTWSVTLEGVFRTFGFTWMSEEDWDNHVVAQHEVGHALGWRHSSGRYGEEYDSRWDVMSRGYLRWEPPWGWLSIHTIAKHKWWAGWIPEARVWRPAPGTVETAVISRSALPPSNGYLMASILRSDGVEYTVEARIEAGQDAPLPGEAILIHEVEGRRAYVVDPDRDGDPNDESARWVPGETFEDEVHNVRIIVEERLPDGFVVTIANQVEPTCIVTLDADPQAGGTARMSEGEAEGACGRTVTVEAQPAEGWRFAEWTSGGASVSDLNPYPLEVDSDIALVATFVRQCRVTLTAVPPEGGDSFVQNGGAVGDCGREVVLSATANEGWRFLGWIGEDALVAEDNPLVLELSDDRALQARFVAQCAVTLSAVPGEGGRATVSEGGEGGDCGRRVTVLAEASEGWGFRRWLEGGEEVSTEASFTFVVDRDRSLSAEFQERCTLVLATEPPEGGRAELVEGGAEGACGRTIVATATPSEGWGFVAWADGGTEVSGEPRLELTLDRDWRLTAGFERLCALELTVAPGAGGAVGVSGGDTSGACGREVSVTAEADPGWLFVEWAEEGTAMGREPTMTFPLEEDRILEARFVEARDLAARMVAHVLDDAEAPSAGERGALDRLGNGNGELDVGDLLALLEAYPDAMEGRR